MRILFSTLILTALPVAAMAEHPGCIIRDDPHMTCTSGTAWDAEIGGCMPVVTG